MRRSLLVLGITLAAALPARADLTHRISSSIQLDVKGASTRAVRVGNNYSISGSGVATSVTAGSSTTADAIGGLGAVTAGVNAVTIPDAKQASGGSSFSFANSYTQGDTVPTAAPTVGAVPALATLQVNLLVLLEHLLAPSILQARLLCHQAQARALAQLVKSSRS